MPGCTESAEVVAGLDSGDFLAYAGVGAVGVLEGEVIERSIRNQPVDTSSFVGQLDHGLFERSASDADEILDRHLGIGEKHFAEVLVADHVADPTHLDASEVHGHDQLTHPLVRRTGAISATDQIAVLGFCGEARPDLLTVDHEGRTLAARGRVQRRQVGGGFGGKAGLYHEFTVISKCAMLTGRPVVWVPPRSEDMKSLLHGRGQIQYAEMGVNDDGTFGKLRVSLVNDAGAYPNVGAHLPGLTKNMAQGTYRFDEIQFDIAVSVTTTTPLGAYRGAGRPEATAMLERLVDQAALEIGMDPIEIRRRNLLTDDAFPYDTLMGPQYDSGRYQLALDRAVEASGYEAQRAEQVARRERGDTKLLGIGVASYVEVTAGRGGTEFGAVEVHDDGSATMYAGTQSHGQGHQTAYAMLVSDQTGIPVDRITLVDGDTDRIRTGGGTGGSRSLQLAGSAVHKATEVMVDQARALAARFLEADEADIVVDSAAGTIGVAGVPAQALSWSDLATKASDAGEPLAGEFDFKQENGTFPFGTHIAVVEVDRETGQVTMLRHIAVDDAGTLLNPLIVEGQQHGGIAAGIGQALFEEILYDEDGNPVTSNFAEYAVPSAAELPMFETFNTETPTYLNPIGAKGIGEAATIGSTPAVQNAVIDAVAHLGVRHIDLPCTAERVWHTIQQADAGTLPDPWRDPPPIFARMRADAAATEEPGDEPVEIVI